MLITSDRQREAVEAEMKSLRAQLNADSLVRDSGHGVEECLEDWQVDQLNQTIESLASAVAEYDSIRRAERPVQVIGGVINGGLAESLFALRYTSKKTQTELAAELGKDQSTIARWEDGDSQSKITGLIEEWASKCDAEHLTLFVRTGPESLLSRLGLLAAALCGRHAKPTGKQMTHSLRTYLDFLHRALGSDCTTCYLVDPEHNVLRLFSWLGVRHPAAMHDVLACPTVPIRMLADESQPKFIATVQDDVTFKGSAFSQREGITSTLTIPFHSRAIEGIVFLNYRKSVRKPDPIILDYLRSVGIHFEMMMRGMGIESIDPWPTSWSASIRGLSSGLSVRKETYELSLGLWSHGHVSHRQLEQINEVLRTVCHDDSIQLTGYLFSHKGDHPLSLRGEAIDASTLPPVVHKLCQQSKSEDAVSVLDGLSLSAQKRLYPMRSARGHVVGALEVTSQSTGVRATESAFIGTLARRIGEAWAARCVLESKAGPIWQSSLDPESDLQTMLSTTANAEVTEHKRLATIAQIVCSTQTFVGASVFRFDRKQRCLSGNFGVHFDTSFAREFGEINCKEAISVAKELATNALKGVNHDPILQAVVDQRPECNRWAVAQWTFIPIRDICSVKADGAILALCKTDANKDNVKRAEKAVADGIAGIAGMVMRECSDELLEAGSPSALKVPMTYTM